MFARLESEIKAFSKDNFAIQAIQSRILQLDQNIIEQSCILLLKLKNVRLNTETLKEIDHDLVKFLEKLNIKIDRFSVQEQEFLQRSKTTRFLGRYGTDSVGDTEIDKVTKKARMLSKTKKSPLFSRQTMKEEDFEVVESPETQRTRKMFQDVSEHIFQDIAIMQSILFKLNP